MKFESRYSGVVEIDEEQIITLKDGFFGFENYHKFVMFAANLEPFMWLECLEKGGPSFLVIDPFIFRPDYEIEIEEKVAEELEIDSPTDVLIYALVTISNKDRPMTANLQGPLIINKKNRKASQVVAGGEWQTKHDIVAEFKRTGDNEC